MTSIEQFAAFLAQGGKPDDGPRAAVSLHLVDTIGALVAATKTSEGQALIRFAAQSAPQGPTSLDLPLRVMTLAALTRLSEIDDIHLSSMTTPGSIVIPGALAIAAAKPRADADALIDAIVAGYEAMIRLGLALDGPTILYRGIWPTYFAAPFGVAAVAARLFGLDAAQTAHALALALTFAAPGVGHHNAATTSRWLAAGQAARNGLTAAQAARAGFTADLGLLDGGFFSGVYGVTPKPAAMTDGLGRAMLLDVSFKPWCAARQTMAATQALKEIMAEGIAADTITAVTAQVLPAHRKMIDHGVVAGDRASHLTSVQFQMAVAACAPDLANDLSQSPDALPEGVRSFMTKIKVESDESLSANYPKSWPAFVRVTTPSGMHERRVSVVPGDPARSFDAKQVDEKFLRFVTPVLGAAPAQTMLSACRAVATGAQPASALIQDIDRACFSRAAGDSRPR